MKIARLLAMVTLLLERKRVPAKELAEIFEVSVRTVYRDMEAINQAGIPVVAWQGNGGGIGLAEGYSRGTDIMTEEESDSLRVALQSYLSIFPDTYAETALKKLERLQKDRNGKTLSEDSIIASFQADKRNQGVQETNEFFRKAIRKSRMVSFHYETERGGDRDYVVEPHYLMVKNWVWYLWAFSPDEEKFIYFQVWHIRNPVMLAGTFRRRVVMEKWGEPAKNADTKPDAIWMVLKVAKGYEDSVIWRLGSRNVFADENGECLAFFHHPDNDELYRLLLSMGEGVEVLFPSVVRGNMRERVKKIFHMYDKPDKELSGFMEYNKNQEKQGG